MDFEAFRYFRDIMMLNLLSNLGTANRMFSKFVASLRQTGRLEETLSQFRPEREEEDMFTSFWNLPEAHFHLSPSLCPCEKSSERAIKYLDDAKFASKLKIGFHHTLQQYCKAIKNAPTPELASSGRDGRQDETLANCYASRAAFLMEADFFEDCLKDIERASRNGFRHKKHLKTLKDRCVRLRGKDGTLSTMESLVSKHIRGRPREQTFHERFKLYQQSQQGGYRFSDWFRNSLLSEEEKPKLKLDEPHPNIPTMSTALRLAYTPEKGRHLVAVRDIHPGELLILEENYCISLRPKEHEIRCLTCADMCTSAVPCPTCSYAIFCGEECRDRGLAKFHKQECKVLPTLAAFSDESPLIMAFRIFTKLTFHQLKNIVPVLKQTAKTLPEEKLGFDDKDVFNAADFRTIYHLCSNKHLHSDRELMAKCAMAFVLLELLIASKTFFVDAHGKPFFPKQEDVSLVGGTLARVLMGVDINCFSLNELQVSLENHGDVIKPTVGRKICPNLSLLNHSCNPSVFSGWGNGFSWSTAIRYIPAGQEVTTSYSKVFYELEKVERREEIENYHFTCFCEACEGNWPLRRSLSSSIFVRCLECSESVTCQTGDCRKCDSEEVTRKNRKTGEQILKAVKAYRNMHSSKRFLNGNYEEDKRVICKLIELLDKHAVMPCKDYVDAQEDLKIYFRREGKFIYVPPGTENSLAKYFWPPEHPFLHHK